MTKIYKTVQYETGLTDWAMPVSYQGSQGSCGPNMIYNAVGIISNLMGQPFEVSRQNLYNMYLEDNHLLGQDAGVSVLQFTHTLETCGVTEIDDLNYGIEQIGTLPSDIAYTDAATHTLQLDKVRHDAYNIETLSHVMSQKLLEGKPLLLYFTAMTDFMSQSSPLSSQSGDNFSSYAGGHAVSVTAVDTAKNMLTVASWGEPYGDHGYFNLSLKSFYPNYGGANSNLWDVYEINGFNGVNLDFNDNTQAAAGAFVSLLDRAPAVGGMTFYAGLLSGGMSLSSVCDSILGTSEGVALYSSASNADYVQRLFDNVMGREAQAGGLSFYVSQLESGVTRGSVAADILTNGMDTAHWENGLYFGSDIGRYNDGLMAQNRVMAAQNYAITLQAQGGHNDVAAELLNEVTTDPGSIWGVALVGVREQLGYDHINGVTLS